MIIVTGGAGFIGSNLVAALDARGERVVVCDWLGTEDKWRNIAKRDLESVVAPEKLMEFLEHHGSDVEAVFHMGAISATTEKDVDLIIETNFRLSRRLWKWCKDTNIQFIYASSAATYGDGTAGFKDDESIESLSRLEPLNPYGWSKHLFDRWVARQKARAAGGPSQCVGLKFFNVYGPNEYHKGSMRSVVEQVYPFAARGEAFQLFKSHNPDYEDGGQLRDFVWVGDCVKVMLWLFEHPKINGLFNLGTGKARSFADLATAVYRAADKAPLIRYRDMPEELRGKYQYFTEADMGKLRSVGYTAPFTSLEDGVKLYVQDYLAKADKYV
ncbi:MAG TPA: ADP-glyceromanno-heptose 6-epimerase [Alphaproteobacteria bacterium]|nr:ADP-glyceromanno-heptose 6-epimerase [Alphaproteobacteria bacterium]